MSKYNKTVLTNAGLDLVIKAARGKTKFTITKTAASADNLADKKIEELQELTDLPNIVQYGQIVDVADSTQDKNVVIGVGLYFNNQDLTQSYDLNTIALYAQEEGTDKEILYGLTTAVEPETMPDYQDEVLFKFNITMFVVVGRADNVTVKVVEDGVVTEDKLKEIIKTLPSESDLHNLRDATKQDINSALNKLRDEIKTLYPLNSPDGNNIYNTTIDLDTYSTAGITKFLGCKLQSTGQMTGFNQATDGLYGWIFNIPKWNGATEFQQIVYIDDYGQGTLIYVRSRVNNEGKTKEDFEKLAAGQVKTVDGKAPDASGDVQTDHYTKAEIDKKVTDLNSRVEAEEHREWTHHADTYEAGLDYSKAHPDVLVSTP